MNQTKDLNSSVTIEYVKNGTYTVVVLPLMGKLNLIGSFVVHMEEIVVSGLLQPVSIPISDTGNNYL